MVERECPTLASSGCLCHLYRGSGKRGWEEVGRLKDSIADSHQHEDAKGSSEAEGTGKLVFRPSGGGIRCNLYDGFVRGVPATGRPISSGLFARAVFTSSRSRIPGIKGIYPHLTGLITCFAASYGASPCGLSSKFLRNGIFNRVKRLVIVRVWLGVASGRHGAHRSPRPCLPLDCALFNHMRLT